MIHTTGGRRVLRSNQAAPVRRPRHAASEDGRRPGHGDFQDSREIWPEDRPNLLARVARAARLAVTEARRQSEMPLPHLYWGRDLDRRRDAAGRRRIPITPR